MPVEREELIDLRLLKSFVLAADHGGFSAAARVLSITQPAVSHQMKRLEEWVGRPLFFRDGVNVSLTTDGDTLLIFARSLIALSSQVHRNFHGSGMAGRVRLGLNEIFAFTTIPKVLALFASLHAGFELVIETSFDNDALYSAIDARTLDLIVVKTSLTQVRGEVVAIVPLVWVGQTTEQCFANGPVPLVTAADIDVVKTSHHALTEAGRPWTIRFRSRNLAALDAAIVAGIGIAASMKGFPTGQAVPLSEKCGLPSLGDVALCMVSATDPASPAVEPFADFLRQVIREMDEGRSATRKTINTANALY